MATGRQRLQQAQAELSGMPYMAEGDDGAQFVSEFLTRGQQRLRAFQQGPPVSAGMDPRTFFEQGTPLRNFWQVLASGLGIKTGRMNLYDAEQAEIAEQEAEQAATLRQQWAASTAAGFDEARSLARGPEELATLDELQRQNLQYSRLLDHPDPQIVAAVLPRVIETESQIDDVLGAFTQRKYKLIDDAAKSLEQDVRAAAAQADEIDGLLGARAVSRGGFRDLLAGAGENDAARKAIAKNYIQQSLNDSQIQDALRAAGAVGQSVGAGVAVAAPHPLVKAAGGALMLAGSLADVVKFAESLPTDQLVEMADAIHRYSVEYNTARSRDLRENVIPALEAQRARLNEFYTPINRTLELRGAPLPELLSPQAAQERVDAGRRERAQAEYERRNPGARGMIPGRDYERRPTDD